MNLFLYQFITCCKWPIYNCHQFITCCKWTS